jgi:hypothetical protein
MLSTLRRWLSVALVLTPLWTAAAQSGSLDSASLARLRPTRFVRVELPDLSRIQGQVTRSSMTELYLSQDDQERRIPTDQIQRAWVRGRATGIGAIVGSVIGLGGGLLLGAVVDAVCETESCGGATIPVGLLGAGVGAGVGAIVGSAIPRWHQVK